jgi:hypothetical protein
MRRFESSFGQDTLSTEANYISRPFPVSVSFFESRHSSLDQFEPKIPSLLFGKVEILLASSVRLMANNPGTVLAAQAFNERPSVVVFVQNMVLFRCRPGAALYGADFESMNDCFRQFHWARFYYIRSGLLVVESAHNRA